MDTITARLRSNLKTIPFFSMLDESKMSKEYRYLHSRLVCEKVVLHTPFPSTTIRMMGALDLLSNLFDVMQVPDKHVICREVMPTCVGGVGGGEGGTSVSQI
jgi:hypothetical protein